MRTGAQDEEYKLGLNGRAISSRPGIGGNTVRATLACSRCPNVGQVNARNLSGSALDNKFVQLGWRLKPRLCPDCQRKPKDLPMTGAQSLAAMKATIAMHDLLTAHFDTANGRFVAGWSDERIAKETGIALTMIAAHRISAFGEIREPTELALIRADITALEKLGQENQAMLTTAIAELRARLAEAGKKLGLAA